MFLCWEYIYFYNCCIFFLNWFFDHYVVSFFVSCNDVYFKVCLISIAPFWFPFAGKSFSVPLLSVDVGCLIWSWSLVDNTYTVLVFVSLQPVYVCWLEHLIHFVKSESRSVMSDSVAPWTIHGILQARILEWVAFPFSRGSSQPRDQTQVSRIVGGFFTSWATREATHLCLR